MPSPVNLDSIYITESLSVGERKKWVVPQFTDPVGLGNNYRFILYRNGHKDFNVFVYNDDLTDGQTNTWPLGDFDMPSFMSVDLVTVEMQCTDVAVYKYWLSWQNASGQHQSATPANPVTNLRGGALGYFSAHTVQSKTIIVP
jgi:hypothetical protein